MSSPHTAADILDRTFLDMRSRLLDLAASLDRIERAEEADETGRDGRLEKIRQSLSVLASPGFDRARQIQMIFSDDYKADWNG